VASSGPQFCWRQTQLPAFRCPPRSRPTGITPGGRTNSARLCHEQLPVGHGEHCSRLTRLTVSKDISTVRPNTMIVGEGNGPATLSFSGTFLSPAAPCKSLPPRPDRPSGSTNVRRLMGGFTFSAGRFWPQSIPTAASIAAKRSERIGRTASQLNLRGAGQFVFCAVGALLSPSLSNPGPHSKGLTTTRSANLFLKQMTGKIKRWSGEYYHAVRKMANIIGLDEWSWI